MSQFYLNGPSVGRSMSAEEFTAGDGQFLGFQSDCGCDCGEAAERLSGRSFAQGANDGPGGCDCGQECCQQMICCCRPVPAPPTPPEVDEACCCKESFRAALGLLCDQQISNLVDFDAAAFVTNTYVAGADLSCGQRSGHSPCTEAEVEAEGRRRHSCQSCSGGASDNLGTLSGGFRRFAPCNRDLLDIEAELHTAGRKDCGFTATQVSLCELDAVVLQGAAACAEGDLTADEVTARNFRCLRQRLGQRLNPRNVCDQDQCSCACDERDCCCAAGLLDTLARNNLSRRVSLATGLLVLQDVTLLGTVGSVLVLANDADNRLYFVCVNSVQFIG